MRDRKEIEKDTHNYEPLLLEVLLDIRDLLKDDKARVVELKAPPHKEKR